MLVPSKVMEVNNFQSLDNAARIGAEYIIHIYFFITKKKIEDLCSLTLFQATS